MVKKVIAPLVFTLLAGCSASTNLDATQKDVSIQVNDKAPLTIDAMTEQTYSTTSFGQYRFKLEADGHEPMYGVMPLKFNGGYLAADILFFAPAMFFNLREVFPYYQFDLEKNEIRYKKNAGDLWQVYTPTEAEIQRAKAYFEKRDNYVLKAQ
ncbi:hypothetical protein C9I90_08660 [Photobacterium aphoticum]|nr:hypothetical protein C9I90_08660 [Photobacterium aphoticum]